ncbi:MAG: glucosyl-3-phosphoglycerate synthase [Thermoleophilaceae bacterium]
MIRSFNHADFALELLLERKQGSVTVVIPAREAADTIGPIVQRVLGLGGLVDQLLVVDAGSADGTAEVAAREGAEVAQEDELAPRFGPVLGKGDAMWRALGAVRGELVAYVDSDTAGFPGHFVTGLLGPLLCEPGVQFVKGAYSRPFSAGGIELPEGGGRVSRLTARPLLAAFYPDLAAVAQPLAGEIASTRAVLDQVPFATGYAVEMAMLLDVRGLVGADAIAQVDIGERRNAHQPLAALEPMAGAVLGAVCERLRREGRLTAEIPSGATVERPPWASSGAAA